MSIILPFLIIPIPSEIPTGYGIESTSGPNKCLIQCRGLLHERDKIQEAADRINLSYGTFMRRVVLDAAEYTINHLPDLRSK
jgi:hypothetical protein